MPRADKRYLIGPHLLQEIRDTIAKVDSNPQQRTNLTDQHGGYRPPIDQTDGPAIRIGSAVGAWSKGSTATVTWIPGGTVTSTMVATNLFADVTNTATYNCAVARAGYTWYLIAAEC